MLTYQNDPLLIDGTVNDLIRTGKKDLLFLDKKKRILNLYSALVKKEDFERRENKYNQILNRMPYVCGLKTKKLFLELLEKYYGKKYNYIIFRKDVSRYCGLKSEIPLRQFNNWLKKGYIPFVAIRVLAFKSENEINLLKTILINTEKISAWRSGSLLPPLKLKDLLTDKNIYFIGASYGDGGFGQKIRWNLSDGVLNKNDLIYSEKYITNIRNILSKVYKINHFLIGQQKKMIILTISNKWFCRYLNFFFDLPFGSKDENLNLPKILPFDKQGLFWRGLSDTDGSYRKLTGTFSIGMKQVELLKQYLYFLNKNGIKANIKSKFKNVLHLNIQIENLNKFAKIIGASHPRKQNTLFNNLKKGPTHRIFKGVRKEGVISGLFDLTKIDCLRVYAGDLVKGILSKTTVTKIMKKLKVSRQTVHSWKDNINTIPIKTLRKLMSEYSLIDFLNLLNKNKFRYTIGTTGSSKICLPTKVTSKIKLYASCVRPTNKGLCLNIRKNPLALKYKKDIENFFGIKFTYVNSKEYRCSLKLINTFFKTFFNYDIPWKPYDNKQIRTLKKEYNKIYE